jgi:hypothetical protein
VLAGLVAEGVILFPLRNLGVPGRGVRRLEGGGELVERGQRVFDVAEQIGYWTRLFLLCSDGVDVDVDDLGLGGEFGVAGDAVVEAGAEAEQQVALVHGPVAVGGAMHAEPLHGKRVGFGEGADAHQGRGDRHVGLFGKGLQFLVASAEIMPPPT